MNLLEVSGLEKNFGGIAALQGVDLTLRPNEILGLIGPNGAGKTTLFNCLSGQTKPDAGRILFCPQGQPLELTGKRPDQVAALGVSRTFQNIRVFGQMRVIENLWVGRHLVTRSGFAASLLQTAGFKKEEAESLELCYRLLEFVGLEGKANQMAGELAYGDLRRLEIARALAAEPRLLLLDEPAAGMNLTETASLDQLILKIRQERGIGIVLIEHDMKLVMGLSDQVLVLDQGKTLAQGRPEEVRQDPEVIAAYLGLEMDHA